MSDSFDAIVGSFPDLPDCQDPFTERVKKIYRTRDRFAHLDRVLRECETSGDPIYRTAAALWDAIAGPAPFRLLRDVPEARSPRVRPMRSVQGHAV
ncbi:MAG: hypothetical protein M0R74_10635 [Dehalococcoidia bacterium]|nr:hypothetical protein [Dehalococcoidia bacterium]